VDSLSGTIQVNSQVGTGTEFIVTAMVQRASAGADETIVTPDELDACRHLRVGLLPSWQHSPPLETNDLRMLSASRLQAILSRQLEQWFEIPVVEVSDINDPLVDIVITGRSALSSSNEHMVERNVLIIDSAIAGTHMDGDKPDTIHIPSAAGPRRMAIALRSLFSRMRARNGLARTKGARSPENAVPVRISSTEATYKSPARIISSPMPCAQSSLVTTPGKGTHQKSETSNPTEDTAKSYVLLVDDNSVNLNILIMYMRKLDCDFVTATNGQEAVEAYIQASRRFDYVLMDVSMPIMDGFAATRSIRKHEHDNALEPAFIVALTGLGGSNARNEASASGVDLFWAKPVPMKQIKSLINKE
jgi:CheY-like chemotaxis protein